MDYVPLDFDKPEEDYVPLDFDKHEEGYVPLDCVHACMCAHMYMPWAHLRKGFLRPYLSTHTVYQYKKVFHYCRGGGGGGGGGGGDMAILENGYRKT